MALNEQEKELAKTLRDKGYGTREISGHIAAKRLGKTSTVTEDIRSQVATSGGDQSGFKATVRDIPSDLNEAFQGAVDATSTGIQEAQEATTDVVEGRIGAGRGTLRVLGSGLRAGARTVGEGIIGAAKLFTSPETERQVSESVSGIAENIGKSQAAQYIMENYNSLSEEQQKDVQAVLGVTEGLAEIGTFGLVTRFSRPVINAAVSKVDDAVSSTRRTVTSLLPERTPNTIDELASEYDSALQASRQLDATDADTARRRAVAEAQASDVSIRERMVGLDEAVKKRLQQAGPEKTKEYLDVVAARNLDDTAPTAYEWGGDYARRATEEMEGLLNDTGSQIGRTRQRYGNLQGSIDQVTSIENRLMNELDKLNLQVVNGRIQRKPGTVTKLNTTNDLNTLQDLVDEFRVVKQSPTLTNLIDYRNVVQSQINFLKSGREISDVVDPLARNVRGEIKDQANKIVGKTEANRLNEYSDFMDAYGDIKSFTDRRAGGEYLLRLALSGRGGEARKVIETIKKHTGKDLMDDAVLMTTVTDMLANKTQKTLFSQQITRSGIDVARVLSGDPTGALPLIGEGLKRVFLDPEEIIQQASRVK